MIEHGYEHLAESFRGFYLSAWEVFLSDVKNMQSIRDCVKYGYHLLRGCFEASKEFVS